MIRTTMCLCRECRIEVEGDPAASALCSCDNCKRRTGAATSWSVYFRDEQVLKREGPLTAFARDPGLPPGASWFCATCGSTLCWKGEGGPLPGHTGFAAGCFNDPTLPVPTAAMNCAQAMPWAVFPPDCALFAQLPAGVPDPLCLETR